jgi:large subunit ribosomal protein L9
LLPQGKATLATPENIAIFEARRTELELKQSDELGAAQARGAQLQKLQLKLTAKAGTEGKLFGSLGTIDIVAACGSAGVPVERSEVRLPDGPLRALGEFEIEMHLHADVNVTVRVEVVADGELVPEEAPEEDDSDDASGAVPGDSAADTP